MGAMPPSICLYFMFKSCIIIILHISQDGGISLPIDDELVAEIKRLVTEEDILRVEDMKPLLNQFVRLSLFRGRPLPPDTNRRYYPTGNTIRNYIYRCRLDMM